MQLNQQQQEAANHIEGPLLILAGAGTGKTKVLTSRIANIIMQSLAMPHQILAVTFTNKAAREMKERVETIIGHNMGNLWMGTFHSVAAKILRKHANLVGYDNNFIIIDTDDQLKLVKQVIIEMGMDEKKTYPRYVLGLIQRFKDQAELPEMVTQSKTTQLLGGKLLPIYKAYQNRLQANNAMDFGDLTMLNVHLFQQNPDILEYYQNMFKYILVDEYQDTNICQYLWLRLLAQRSKNICCVGDDDQSIYSWRGAEIGNILRFEKDFEGAKIVRLEQNYRSTSSILEAASTVIANNKQRMGKTLFTDEKSGDAVKLYSFYDEREEAGFASDEIYSLAKNGSNYGEMAILVRAGFQTRAFEEAFLANGIAYKVIGGMKFYERKEVKDILSYLKLIVQPSDNLSFERIINVPKRGLGDSSLKLIRDLARDNNISLYASARILLAEGGNITPRVRSTLGEFIKNLDQWREMLGKEDHAKIAEMVIHGSGYLDMLEHENNLEAASRKENLGELIKAISDFENLNSFLEHVSLVTDIDQAESGNMVSIMTLHAAKGLEFEIVFLPGWEEGLFPHQKSMEENGQEGIEEERRLAYVGMTRARKKLYISFAASRWVFRERQYNVPSRFINELPREKIDIINYGYSAPKQPAAYHPVIAAISKSSAGKKVTHPKFGQGVVVSDKGDYLEIGFEGQGIKKIVKEFVEFC